MLDFLPVVNMLSLTSAYGNRFGIFAIYMQFSLEERVTLRNIVHKLWPRKKEFRYFKPFSM